MTTPSMNYAPADVALGNIDGTSGLDAVVALNESAPKPLIGDKIGIYNKTCRFDGHFDVGNKSCACRY
jgi:hypothetical protein